MLDLPYQKRILRFWDLGGAPSMRSLWAQYMADAHVLVWVIDGPAWIHNASVENEAAPTYRDATSLAWRAVAEEAHTRGQPIVVLVTKMDDVSSASLVDEIHASLTKTWREGHSDTTPAYALSCYGVSAKTGYVVAYLPSARALPPSWKLFLPTHSLSRLRGLLRHDANIIYPLSIIQTSDTALVIAHHRIFLAKKQLNAPQTQCERYSQHAPVDLVVLIQQQQMAVYGN